MSAASLSFDHVKVESHDHAFSIQLEKPTNWIVSDVPEDAFNQDFSDPMQYAPVGLIVDPVGQLSRPPMFMIATRPAFAKGTLADLVLQICEAKGFEHGPIEATRIGNSPAAACTAVMVKGDGAKIFLALIQDGSRLVNVNFIAPPAKWDACQPTMKIMLDSFKLAGSSVQSK